MENRAGNNEQACFSTSHVKAGDLLAITSAGAYGFFVASIWIFRGIKLQLSPIAAEVLVQGKTHQLIRRRQNCADLVQLEIDAAHELHKAAE
jgi:hypothetical protein